MPLTLEQLVALPYGDGTPQTLPIGDLLNLPYSGGSANTKGMVAKEFRRNMRDHGEPVDWLSAIESSSPLVDRQGEVFIEQVLPDEQRAFIYQNERTIQTEEWGEIAAGTTMLSWMPDEIFPVRDDRFRASLRTFQARQVLQPSDDITRALEHLYPVAIDKVYVNDEPVGITNYALVSGGLMWINGYLPTTDAVVLYSYRPVYELMADRIKQGPLGADGKRLPSSAPLRLLTPGEE